MSEQNRSRSPLESERGITTVDSGVISKIVGMVAGEVEGIHLDSGASRIAGGFLGGVTGSRGPSRGVSVEVGRVETAIDLTMEIEYGKNILRTVERVRDGITERVENLTGLRVAELNVTINDIIFPEGEEERRGGSAYEDRARRTEEIEAGGRERENADETEPIEVSARRRARNEREPGNRAEGAPPEEDPTTELRLGDEETRRRWRRER